MRWSLDQIRRTVSVDGFASESAAGRDEGPAAGRISIDTRTLASGDVFVAIVGERFDGHDFVGDAVAAGAAAAIVHRELGPDGRIDANRLIRVPDTLDALHALAAWARAESEAKVVGVTGSNGKTTTREMIALVVGGDASVLSPVGNRNNHIGLPLTLLDLGPEHRYAVLELAMNHPGEISRLTRLAGPDLAVITNVGRAHLGPVGGIDAVRRAKLEIVEGLPGGGVLLVPARDPELVRAARARWARVETFGPGEGADHPVTDLGWTDDGEMSVTMAGFPSITLRGPGRPAALAACAALAVADVLGLPRTGCAGRLAAWRPIPGRMAVRRARGVTVLDDSYNANPDSMAAALETLLAFPARGRRIAVLGEMRELGDAGVAAHEELGRRASSVDRLMLVGSRTAPAEASAVRSAVVGLEVTRHDDVESLIAELVGEVTEGDVVLVKGSRAVGLERVVAALTRDEGRD